MYETAAKRQGAGSTDQRLRRLAGRVADVVFYTGRDGLLNSIAFTLRVAAIALGVAAGLELDRMVIDARAAQAAKTFLGG